jgi:hypothetical protein
VHLIRRRVVYLHYFTMASNHHQKFDLNGEQDDDRRCKEQAVCAGTSVSVVNGSDDLEEKIRSKILSSNYSNDSFRSLELNNNKMHSSDNNGSQMNDNGVVVAADVIDVNGNSMPSPASEDDLVKQKMIQALQSTNQYSLKEQACDKSKLEGIGDKFKSDMYDIEKLDPEFAGLAVAIPVKEEDESDDRFLPAAIEFDPDKKKTEDEAAHRSSRRKISISIVLVLVIIASITVGVVVGTKKHSKVQELPVHPRLQVGIIAFLQANFPSDAHHFRNPLHPLAQAMDWMTYTDPQLLVPSTNSTFLQRFLMVYLYYQTEEKNNWRHCYPHGTTYKESGSTDAMNSTDSDAERCSIYVAGKSGELEWVASSAKFWLSKTDECDWIGNKCDDFGHMKTIVLGKFLFLFCHNVVVL